MSITRCVSKNLRKKTFWRKWDENELILLDPNELLKPVKKKKRSRCLISVCMVKSQLFTGVPWKCVLLTAKYKELWEAEETNF